jgi:hypothetical protein
MTGQPGTGRRAGTGSDGGPSAGTEADCDASNGGLVPNENGMMIGLPVDEAALAERWSGPPKPKGPKPILKMPAQAGGAAEPEEIDDDTSLPPGWELIGRPGPYDRRYALSNDKHGVVIHGLDPLRRRESKPPSAPS